MLEVECATPPDAIWLATEELARDSVALQSVGNGRYQVNLADARVAALLPTNGTRGELFVFARAAGKVTKSAAVAWSRRGAVPTLRCLLRTKAGATAPLSPWWPTWIDAQRVDGIEIVGDPARDGSMVLCAGTREVQLPPDGDRGGWWLPIGKLPAEAITDGTFVIEARGGQPSGHLEDGPGRFRFRIAPDRLDLPQQPAELRISQRSTTEVPGSREWLQVRIADITAGRVETSIETADGVKLVARRSMFERDSVEFALASGRYVLRLDRLVNQLIGDDHADFSVHAAAGFEPDRIGQLLSAIEASKHTFVRGEIEDDGESMMLFLLAKVSGRNGRKVKLEQFVDEVGSKSSETGEAFRVKREDGTVVSMQQWLRDELQCLENPPTKDDGAGKAGGGNPPEPARK